MSGSPSDACDLTLDPNTAYRRLSLSEDNRKVTVGVYLDRPAGSLSFYRVSPGGGGSSDTLTHLHTFWSSFTQEDLLPGVRSTNGPSWVLTSIRVPTGPPAPPGERALRSERSGTFTDCLCDDGGI
ncbi:unnamed protein product [Gadus morhua 'NCC']